MEIRERKHPQLWQAYLTWQELVELRKTHNLRLSAIRRDVSNLDEQFEIDFISVLNLDIHVDPKNKEQRSISMKQVMINYGKAVGPIWEWLLSHKGIGEGLAAQLLAQVDDIERFDSISKLWRFCGYGLYEYWVNEDGKPMAPKSGWKWVGSGDDKKKVFVVCLPKSEQELYVQNGNLADKFIEPDDGWTLSVHRDVNITGWHSPYNRLLKALLFNISDQFIRQQSPRWVEIYYNEKEYQRGKHPEPVKSGRGNRFSDGHIHNRAWRKMAKAFLREFWLEWRRLEGLPITQPYEVIKTTRKVKS